MERLVDYGRRWRSENRQHGRARTGPRIHSKRFRALGAFQNAFLDSLKNPAFPPLPTEPRPGRYRHYKGKEYRVLGIARHSETLEALVVYQALYGDMGLWVRPARMFTEIIGGSHPGTTVPRFAFVAAD